VNIIKIIINPNLCFGCKTCQLVCSFHHTGFFWPYKSSISIFRNPQNAIIKCSVNSTCDVCKDENMPLCIKYCVYNAIGLFREDKMEEKL